jgi:hypothetical protein
MSPFLGYLILQSDFHLALGVFVFASISDLVSSFMGDTNSVQPTSQPVTVDQLSLPKLSWFTVPLVSQQIFHSAPWPKEIPNSSLYKVV